jgi:ABC-type transport system involved in multi-copper enzyme maturation permease subunit
MVRAFRHELLKLRRPTMVLGSFGAMIVLALLGVVITVTRAGNGRADVSLASLSQPDGFATMLQRATELLGIVALAIVAIAVAQDYSTGMLRSMLMREPRRLRLLAGKLAADLAFTVAAVAVALLVAFGVAMLIGPSRGIDTAQWVHAGLGTTLAQFGAELLVSLGFGVFGAALAVVLRSPATAVIVGVAWALPVETLLGRVWSGLEQWLPVHQLEVIASRGSDATLSTAFLLAAGFVAAAACLSTTLFVRSDVTA